MGHSYRGHADKIKCPGNDVNSAEKQAMQGRVRVQHEMLNGRLKNWDILSRSYLTTFCFTAMCSRHARH